MMAFLSLLTLAVASYFLLHSDALIPASTCTAIDYTAVNTAVTTTFNFVLLNAKRVSYLKCSLCFTIKKIHETVLLLYF